MSTNFVALEISMEMTKIGKNDKNRVFLHGFEPITIDLAIGTTSHFTDLWSIHILSSNHNLYRVNHIYLKCSARYEIAKNRPFFTFASGFMGI